MGIIEDKKVLLISNNGMGFYNFKRELVEKLVSHNYETHFAVPYYEKLEELIDFGAYYHEISINRRGINPVKDLSLIAHLYRLAKEIKPDIMILHTIKPNIYGSLIAIISKINYINNITGLGSALQGESKLAKLLRVMYRISLSKSSGIFFENEGNKKYFVDHKIGNASKYIVVPGAGVNTNLFSPNSRNDGNKLTFLFIARIMKEKGIEEYLEAAERIKRKYNDVYFQILGWYDEENYKNRIEKLVQEGIVQYIGVSSDTRVEMSRADCLVLPSYHEGMSNVLLEGASMGLPLITTDVHGCKEAVEDGKNGFLCKARDTKELVNAMERFIALSPEERKQMGLQGREKMIAEFDRKLVVDQYAKIIQEAIKE